MTANLQTQQLIEQFEKSVEIMPGTQESYLHIRHVQVRKSGQTVEAEIRLHITTNSDRFINKNF